MAIEFSCPCGRVIRAKDGSRGRVFACPACGQSMEVPAPGAVDLGIVTAPPMKLAPSPTAPAEHEYRMIQVPPRVEIRSGASHNRRVADFLEGIVNKMALDGWEFFRVDTLGVTENPGCIASLFGANTFTVNYYVVTFRRPRTAR
jgi:hypothetical protein